LLLFLISSKLQLVCDDFNDAVEITLNTVRCDKFIICAELNEKKLHIKITSDLPSNTIINVDVCRQFWGVGSSNNYTISYYSEYAAIAKWKTGTVINLDDKAWLEELQNKKEVSGNAGKPIRISEISDSVEIQIYLPLQVDNFGMKNKNLIGKEVLVANINYIQKSISIYSPLINSPAKSKLRINGKWIDISEVRPVGIIYVHQEQGTIHVDFLHNNGNVTKLEAMEVEASNDTRYYIKNNYEGEYFIIRNDGNLYWYDDFGLIMKCYKYQK